MPKLSKRQVLLDGLRLKCPKCHRGDMFADLFKMNLNCSDCGFKFEREPGYFVGAMYINYGATVFIAFGGYFALDYLTPISFLQNFILWIVFSGLFPAFFFRYSRSLWLSFDYMFNPS
ncbi:MAG: DUF983 domain-containing protein [Candidatus Poribacteria bacterium]|nr:DUF983 domain-containing protein [Candidatus Poribacteria bacterium]